MGCCGGIVRTLARGTAGVAKAVAGVDAAPEAVTQRRRDVCRECPEATREDNPKLHPRHKGLTVRSVCRACKCNIALKTRVGGESCPLGKWPAHGR